MKTIGILSQSPEGAALCFLACCEEGARQLGPLMHPDIVMATARLGDCLPAYITGDLDLAVPYLEPVVATLAAAGADFYVCAANTPHGAIALFTERTVIPCLHIADAVTAEILANGWLRVGILGARSTMTGTIYRDAFRRGGVEKLIPEASVHARLDTIVFQEINQGLRLDASRAELIAEIAKFEERGADCVVLACTEFSLLIAPEQSPLPMLDSAALLARAAVNLALGNTPLLSTDGWVRPSRP